MLFFFRFLLLTSPSCRCCLYQDHHCPFTASCIGAGNYQYFFAFVVRPTSRRELNLSRDAKEEMHSLTFANTHSHICEHALSHLRSSGGLWPRHTRCGLHTIRTVTVATTRSPTTPAART